MKLTLSADHRIANGRDGALYMSEVKRVPREPGAVDGLGPVALQPALQGTIQQGVPAPTGTPGSVVSLGKVSAPKQT